MGREVMSGRLTPKMELLVQNGPQNPMEKNQKWGEKAALTADQVCALLRENYTPWQGYMSCDVFLPG